MDRIDNTMYEVCKPSTLIGRSAKGRKKKSVYPMKWTYDQEVFLIEELKRHKFLWDQNHENYNKRKLRTYTFKSIAMDVKYHWPEANINGNAARQRFNYMKTQYFKERRRLKERTASALADAAPIHPSFFHFQSLTFLDDLMSPPNNSYLNCLNAAMKDNEDEQIVNETEPPSNCCEDSIDEDSIPFKNESRLRAQSGAEEAPCHADKKEKKVVYIVRKSQENEDSVISETLSYLKRSVEVREQEARDATPNPLLESLVSNFKAKQFLLSEEKVVDLYKRTLSLWAEY